MTEKQIYMIEGMDRLLKKFNKYPNEKEFTVEDIINASNEVYDSIINGIRTVTKYKEVKEFMEQKATEFFQKHKSSCEEWKEGEIKKVWLDVDINLCIEYESGEWWHYNDIGEWY